MSVHHEMTFTVCVSGRWDLPTLAKDTFTFKLNFFSYHTIHNAEIVFNHYTLLMKQLLCWLSSSCEYEEFDLQGKTWAMVKPQSGRYKSDVYLCAQINAFSRHIFIKHSNEQSNNLDQSPLSSLHQVSESPEFLSDTTLCLSSTEQRLQNTSS